MAKRKRNELILRDGYSYSRSTRWTSDGVAETRTVTGGKDSGWQRDPSMDYGTPMGDLIIDPWIQDALKGK
jgi:hypothetical protein